VLGFSFGRALGLPPRREPRTSLLAAGTSGIDLDTSEVEQARKVARTVKGVMTIAEARKAADSAQKGEQAERARTLGSWLGEIRAGNTAASQVRGESKAAPSGTGAKPECGPSS
jgi:hypothetical protein